MAGMSPNKIFDFFKGDQQNQQQQQPNNQQNNQQNQQQQPNPGNMERPQNNQQQQNQQNNQQQNQNLNDPSNQNNQQQNQQQKSPLADFATLWETDDAGNKGNNQQNQQQANQPDWNEHGSIVPELNLDPKKIFEGAKRIDFSKVMPADKVAAALKGDTAAFGEVINSVSQALFANMAMSSSRLVKAALSQMADKLYSGALPHHFRKNAVSSQIDTDLPILTNPAVAPMFETMKAQLQVKYPKSSPQEISAMAKRMVTEFADAVKAPPGSNQQQQVNRGLNKTGSTGDDWSDFFDVESRN